MSELTYDLTIASHAPFQIWLDTTKCMDPRDAMRELIRFNRLATESAGDAKAVDYGVMELRIDHGSGYRVYYDKVG